MEVVSNIARLEARKKPHWSRQMVAEKNAEYIQTIQKIGSQRQTAQEIGVPRTTLQHWLARQGQTGLEKEVEVFFESPPGAAFLHQLFIAAHFSMTQVGPGGNRLFCSFLELSQLDKLVGNSYGSIQKFSVQAQQAIAEFEQSERARLSSTMPEKQITITQDETYHPEVCLAAIEPVSNFIMLEKYSEKRDSASWELAMTEATEGLNVTIVQSTSDEGLGILKYVEESLGAHHSPDLFHVQFEITKGTSAALSAKVRQAENELLKAKKIHEEVKREHQDESQKEQRGRGRPLDTANLNPEGSEICLMVAYEELNIAIARKTGVSQAKRAIGDIYHPYSLENGALCSSALIKKLLEEQLKIIETEVLSAGLSENSKKRIEKARRVLPQMILTITFFWSMVKSIIQGLNLDRELVKLMYKCIIPVFYLQMAGKKIGDSAKKKLILAKAQECVNEYKESATWGKCPPEQQDQLEKVAHQSASIFQRSSSCVEGRNGQLSLSHHSLHKLSEQKLKSSTTIHNYWIKRTDGTTAAERFFGNKPKDLFLFLLGHLNLPARPAKKRSKFLSTVQKAA